MSLVRESVASLRKATILQQPNDNEVTPTKKDTAQTLLLQNGKRNSNHRLNTVYLSKLATSKIVKHGIKGGNIEIMGMLVGNVHSNTVIVYDCYELPVEGTETRVNAHMESYEFMVQYFDKMVKRRTSVLELNIVGWYHSHPGYDCWLSHIDMQTQRLNQQYQDPYVAIVIDPHKTLANARLAIGAFRTQNGDDLTSYELSIRYFGSTLDAKLDSMSLHSQLPDITDDKASTDSTILTEKLVNIMKQWHSHEDIARKQQLYSTALNQNNIQNYREQYHYVSNLFSTSSSVVSMSSIDNDSSDRLDKDEEMSSTTSSLYLAPEQIPSTRRQQEDADPLTVGPYSTLSRHIGGEDNTGLRNGNYRLEERDYVTAKKQLLSKKLGLYQRLRFMHDTFTS